MKTSEYIRFVDIPRAIWFFLAEDRKRYVFFTILLLIALSYSLVPPFIIGKLVDFLVKYHMGDSLNPLYFLAALLGLSSAAVALIRLASKRFLGRIGINSRYRARVWGFERLLDFSLAWHHKENTGNKAQRIITGAESVREMTRDLGNKIFPTIVSFTGTTIACVVINPWFALFFLYYMGGILLSERYFDTKISRISDRINKSIENASGSLVEGASNILAVKAMGAQSSMTTTVANREDQARKMAHERIRLSNSKWMCSQVHNSISWGIFIFFIGFGVVHGVISVGLMLTFSSYFNSLRESALDFADHIQTVIEQKSNLSRMMPLFWGDHRLKTGDHPFPHDFDGIHIHNATFRYKENAALSGVSLDVARGEKIGIAGHSGSGKSTLIKLLLGLYHIESGSLKIGATKHTDIQHKLLAENVSVVLQETELFNFSLRENITMMKDVDPQLFSQACTIACINELIARLPDGVDTLIGERGYSLSGGERQRVGIARAICRNAPILLLDEATSALDSVTEQHVMDGLLGRYGEDKTMLIVAHRISTLKNTDRIIVFENGKIVEEGVFDTLSRQKSTRFGGMYAMQAV